MREIPLTEGRVAIVDDADYDALSVRRWSALYSPGVGGYYAVGRIKRGNRWPVTMMHRHIMAVPHGKRDVVVDHKNHDTLDNRRENLRICTASQNIANARKYANNKSGYRGVYWGKLQKGWVAQIKAQGRIFYLGCFDSPEQAAAVYAIAARMVHGEYANPTPVPEGAISKREEASAILRVAQVLSPRYGLRLIGQRASALLAFAGDRPEPC